MKRNLPQISIIIPVYNVEIYLSRCINSILSQTFSNFEILLIDDGSKDKSGEICDEYTKKDNRIRVFHKKNEGVSSARNVGLDKANGEWITFVDSDDWIEEKCLEVILKHATKNALDCIQFSYKRINDKGEIFEINSAQTPILDLNNYINMGKFSVCAGGTMFKRDIIDNNNIRFIEGLKLAEDQIFILTIICSCKRLQRIPNMFYCYYLNENSATQKPKFIDICKSIIDLDTFKYRMRFQSYIDTMILKFIFVSLKQNNCNIMTLYRTLKKTKVNAAAIRVDFTRYWLLKKMWKHNLIIALLLIRLNDKLISLWNNIKK
ncbi:glycosyltransferase [uncultured Bacteroides sp.]|uniref:glycosyltransferase family 2 protein n=1 Tax=uncultured Bacteroides sp. TaxID=162156 RepID=UPI002AA7ED99|nr:glycosyltransferase [uncultured Bacteroides sp.]